jgi:hypothetical protein
VLQDGQGMVSVRLDGRPAGEAGLALTRLAPVIAARLAAARLARHPSPLT